MGQKEDKKSVIGASIAVMLLLIVVIAVFIQSVPKSTPTQLYPQEIRNYQGENLSSINDFAENSINGPQYINASIYTLKITGLVNKTIIYTYDDIINNFTHYQKTVTLYCVEGWIVKILWEGILVSDLIKDAGVNQSAVAVIFRAYDGYSTSLPLNYISSKNIIIAYKINGVVLPADHGFPFQLVSESQYGYKWIKWITQIELTDNPNYLGYWESRGYPNNATIGNPFP
jgi:DMSO/TMAO reductase YedYZ molybdopterin-dependent catalytic subunit